MMMSFCARKKKKKFSESGFEVEEADGASAALLKLKIRILT